MSKERATEIKETLYELNRKLLTLEWDNNRNQINPYKKMKYEQLLAEKVNLESELDRLNG